MVSSAQQIYIHLKAYYQGEVAEDVLWQQIHPSIAALLGSHFGKKVVDTAYRKVFLTLCIHFQDSQQELDTLEHPEAHIQQLVLQSACRVMIQGEPHERQQALTWISQTYREGVFAFVRNKISPEHADDFANQALVIYMEQLLDGKLDLSHQPQAYLIGIAQNLIRKHYRKEAIHSRHQDTLALSYATLVDEEVQFHSTELQSAIQQLLGHLGQKCQQILRMWMMRFSMEEIAAQLEFNSEAVARTSKRRCMKQLMKQLENLPDLFRTLQELR